MIWQTKYRIVLYVVLAIDTLLVLMGTIDYYDAACVSFSVAVAFLIGHIIDTLQN